MKPEILRFDRVSFAYSSQRRTLDEVSFSLRAGEWLAVMGQNGSGKSTLAKLAMGLLQPAAGSVRVMGVDSAGQGFGAMSRHIGYLSQHPEDHIVGLTVGDDVALGPRQLGLPDAEVARRVQRALAVVGMQGSLEKATNQLSGGELQRAALAGVFAITPKLLVLDEPTAQCDSQVRRAVARWVQELRADNNTAVLWITHRADEAASADRVLVMQQGRVAFDGHLTEIPQERWQRWGIEPPRHTPDRPPACEPPRDAGGAVALRLSKVECGYGSHLVLRGVDIEVRHGEVVALWGASGAGKSTLLHVAALLEPHTRGELQVLGQAAPRKARMRAARREAERLADSLRPRVAVAFQQPEQQLFGLTVRDDFLFGLRHLGFPNESWDDRMRNALERVGLPIDVLDRSPFALSGGERRRVAIALGFAQEPELFLLDEPAAGLDYPSRQRMMEAVSEGAVGGKRAMLFTTHDLDVAAAWAHRSCQMVDGVVLAGQASAASGALTGVGSAAALRTNESSGGDATVPPAHSPLRRVDLRVRLLGGAMLAGVVATLGTFGGLVAAGGMIATLSALAKVRMTQVWSTVRGLLPFVLVAALFSMGGGAWHGPGALRAGAIEGALLGGRMLLLVLSVHWLTRTAGVSELLSGMRSLLWPLARIGLPVDSLTAAVLVAVRMIPVLGDEARRIQRAQLARGVGRVRGLRGLWLRAVSLVVPLSAAGLRRAERLGEALVTRGYGTGPTPSARGAMWGWAEGVFISLLLVAAGLMHAVDRWGG